MKNIILSFLFAIPILCSAQRLPHELPQNGLPIFSVNEETIVTDNRFIDYLPIEPRFDKMSYTLTNPVSIPIAGVTYIVRTAKFVGWENEPGDFNVIEISRDGNSVYLLKDPNGIYNARNSKAKYPYSPSADFSSYADNNHCFVVPLSESAVALIFIGKVYGSGDTQLYIFVLTPKEMALVCNKSLVLTKMSKEHDHFSMNLRTNQYQVVNGVQGNKFRTFTIWKKDGALWIKDN